MKSKFSARSHSIVQVCAQFFHGFNYACLWVALCDVLLQALAILRMLPAILVKWQQLTHAIQTTKQLIIMWKPPSQLAYRPIFIGFLLEAV